MPGPSRRDMLRYPAAALTAPLLGNRASAADGLESTVVIRTTGGVFERSLKANFFDPFTKATGVRVVPFAASYGDMMARATAMQAAGRVEWDIISPQYTELAKISGMLEDLGDCSGMPNVRELGTPEACGRYGVLYLFGAQMLAWNPNSFKGRKPASWKDFWDVETFPGRRALPNTGSPWATLILSVLADGVPADKLFPLDLDRAFRKLDEIKPHIGVWWRTGDQAQKMWASDDIAMSMLWLGTAYSSKRAGIPLEWTYNQSIADFGAWCILKGAPHPKAARAFIDFYMTNPDAHVAFAREMGYTTPNVASRDKLDAELKRDLISTSERVASIIKVDAEWLDANRATMLGRWNAWISS